MSSVDTAPPPVAASAEPSVLYEEDPPPTPAQRIAATLGWLLALGIGLLIVLHFAVPEGSALHLSGPLADQIVTVASAVILGAIALGALGALIYVLYGTGLDRGAIATCLVLLAVAALVPALNLWTAPSSSLHIANYLVPLIGKYLCYALLALSVGLIWGYAGILSLGHGAFFALGGYAMGMYLMRQIGSRGVYGDPVLPDFMVFLNWKELPWYWNGFDHFPFAALMVLLVPGILAFVFGWFAFRSRVTGVYLSIITQAMTYALLLAFFRNDTGFGGNNGLTDFKDILGANIQAQETRAVLFALSAVALALGYLASRALIGSKYGQVLVAIRDSESRTRFLGYRVERHKLFVFVVSAVMAGIAGALYVPQVGIINPGEFAPANSIEVVVWVAVGGRGTLVGPIVGAVMTNLGKSWFTTGALAEYWLFVLGGLFVLVTLFLPKGIVGTICNGWNALAARRASAAAEAGEDVDTAPRGQIKPQPAE